MDFIVKYYTFIFFKKIKKCIRTFQNINNINGTFNCHHQLRKVFVFILMNLKFLYVISVNIHLVQL